MRQAVVLIHGIGEQKPMGTVRGFVKAVLQEHGRDEPAYWSKPDRMSQLFELRLLRSRGRSSTDFYEYYWAYNLSGSNLWDLARWLGSLTARRWKDVPRGARTLWLLGRLTIVLIALGIVMGVGARGFSWFASLPKAGVAWIVLVGALLLVQSIVVSYVGDAARYLSPLPRNIKLRQTIRRECIGLLRTLHESGKYDRLIIVGHSLGSIIGYDAITHLWQEYHDGLPNLTEASLQEEIRQCMDTKVSPQPMIRDELARAAAALCENGAGVDEFQRCQVAAWRELRHFGNAWRISDFITVGSPLAHAALLMADSEQDFGDRRRERELLTCPPQRDDKGYAYSGQTADIGNGRKFTPLVLHHAAAFAVTRWTNLYFPAALGLFGDVVGGPLRGVFGLGIRDIPVSIPTWLGRTPLAHTCYWLREEPPPIADAAVAADAAGPAIEPKRKIAGDRVDSLSALRRALDLSNLQRLLKPRGAKSVPDKSRPQKANAETTGAEKTGAEKTAPVRIDPLKTGPQQSVGD
jgi:hypothetical protein